MAQDDPKKQAGQTNQASPSGKERTERKRADQAILKEMDRRDRLLLSQIREVRDVTMRLAEASSFQFSIESSLQEISDKLTPIRDLTPQPADLNENEVYWLEKIRRELARPDERLRPPGPRDDAGQFAGAQAAFVKGTAA